jgi:hypothetical protein
MISVARLRACDQTDGSTPASLKTDTVRLTAEDRERSWADIVGGSEPVYAKIRRIRVAFFMNPLLATNAQKCGRRWRASRPDR